jgi:hypothetical protein
MILYAKVSVKKIFEEGKDYAWRRPERCPECGSGRLWGHGYVERYFEGFETAIWIKRWRCRDCGGVHTMRPEGFWRRFRHSVGRIVQSLKEKIAGDRWLGEISRQAQQYWWRGFGRQCGREGKNIGRKGLEILEGLLEKGIIAATHSLEFFRIQTLGGIYFTPAG